MLTRSDMPRLLLAGLKTQFMTGQKEVSLLFPQFTTEINSNKASENYGWLGSTPQLQEWKDERAPKALLENGFILVNKDYEATIGVDKNALDDDQYGQVKIRVQQMGSVAMKGMDRIAAEAVEAGTSQLAYDGQNFFDTDHLEDESGVQSNYVASGGALSVANAKTAITAMRNFKDDKGQIAGVNPTHIMVPTNLEFVANEIFNPAVVSGSTTPADRVLSGILKIIVNPYLSTSGGTNAAWYLLDLSGVVKPFIYQNREAMKFEAQDTGYVAFMRKELFYGVSARFAFGYGDWRLAYKSKG